MLGQCSIGVSNLNRGRRHLVAKLEKHLHQDRKQLFADYPTTRGLLLRKEVVTNPCEEIDDIVVEFPLGYLLYQLIQVPGGHYTIAEIVELAAIESDHEEIYERLMARFVGLCHRNDWEFDNNHDVTMMPQHEKQKSASMDMDLEKLLQKL